MKRFCVGQTAVPLLCIIGWSILLSPRLVAHDHPQRSIDMVHWNSGCALRHELPASQSRGAADARKALVVFRKLSQQLTKFRAVEHWNSFFARYKEAASCEQELVRLRPRPATSLIVNFPEQGNAPRPDTRSVASLSALQASPRRLDEEYRPYDLAVRDWRFYIPMPQGSHKMAWNEIPEVFWQFSNHDDSHAAAAIDQSRRVAVSELEFDYRSLSQQWNVVWKGIQDYGQESREIIAKWNLAVSSYFARSFQQEQEVPLEPFHDSPQHMIFEFDGGKRCVVSIEQAENWGLIEHPNAARNQGKAMDQIATDFRALIQPWITPVHQWSTTAQTVLRDWQQFGYAQTKNLVWQIRVTRMAIGRHIRIY